MQGDDDDDDEGIDFTKDNDPINQVYVMGCFFFHVLECLKLSTMSNNWLQVNLVGYIGDFITKFCNSDRPLFDHLCEVVERSW